MQQGGNNPRLSAFTGTAGEYSVAAQLLIRGLNVFFPSVDNGVDLLTESGCRIQIKSAHLRCSPSVAKWYPEGIYTFHFPKRKYMATSKGEIRERINRKFSEYCDIVVLWGIEQNRFWVVPSDLLDGMQCIALGQNKLAKDFSSSTSALIRSNEGAWHNVLEFEKVAVTFPHAGTYVLEEQEK